MKKLLAIVVCKLLRIVGKLMGKGSSLPGQFALKICPDILSRVKLPPYVIAVTGSNGKTSTVEMIAAILRKSGKTVVYNEDMEFQPRAQDQLRHKGHRKPVNADSVQDELC